MEAVKSFDLSEVEQDETSIVKLTHPSTGDELTATIEVYGQDSDTYREAARKAETKYTEYARRNRGKMMPAADREKLEMDKIVACTKAINNLSHKGTPVTDARTAFHSFPWIHEQASAAIHERANFIKSSSPA